MAEHYQLDPDDPGIFDKQNAPIFTRMECRAMNAAFAKALIEARKAGLEKFSIGTFVDKRPFKPTKFFPQPRGSGISSSAAMCAEGYEREEAEQALFPTVMMGRK